MTFRPRSPMEVEEEMDRLAAAMEEATEDYRTIAIRAASAESDYKSAFARCIVGLANSGKKITAAEREARAVVSAEAEFREWRISEASRAATSEHLRTLRSRLDAMRTEAASRRYQG